MASKRDVDGGWAWMVLFMTAFGHVIDGYVVISLGFYQAEFLKMFTSSTSVTSLLSSVFLFLQLVLGPVSGILCDIFSLRTIVIVGGALLSLGFFSASMVTELPHLLLTYGILAGTGFGLLFTPLCVITGHYFVKKRAVANGITVATSGPGFIAGAYFCLLLIHNYGWRHSLLIEACFALQYCIVGATYFPLETELATQRRRIKHKASCCQVIRSKFWFFKEPQFWIMVLNYGFQMIGWAIQVVHFPSYAESQGIDANSLSQLYFAFGLSVALSRLLCGVLCNDPNLSMVVILSGVEGCQGVVTLLMPFYAKTYAGCMTYQILMSFYYGAALVPITPLAAELFGLRSLASTFGWIMMAGGFASLIGPVLAGWLRDISGSYTPGFHVAGLFEIAGSLLLLLIPVCRKQTVTEDQNNEEMLFHQDKEVVIDENIDICSSDTTAGRL